MPTIAEITGNNTGCKLFSLSGGFTLANSSTPTDMVNGGTVIGSTTVPAGALKPGTVLRLHSKGTCNSLASPGNVTIVLLLGSTVLAQFGAAAFTGSASSAEWELDLMATIQTAGANGSVVGGGLFKFRVVATGLVGCCALQEGVSSGFDTTGALTFTWKWTWATADPGNSISVGQAIGTIE